MVGYAAGQMHAPFGEEACEEEVQPRHGLRSWMIDAMETSNRKKSMEDALVKYAPEFGIVGRFQGRRRFFCSRCGLPGHNRSTCWRVAERRRVFTRLCKRCGQPGHHWILCREGETASAPSAPAARDGDDGSSKQVDGPKESANKVCKWHQLKEEQEKLRNLSINPELKKEVIILD
ncbi:hypothetical protein EJB05_45130 [Eragrostis curvula]|uniref:CCHC-type domain-containing protein n=1 Tax=Eragrostis curvula TaxID=38414 RepID=A0A5J9TK50_9POAL|nr:hypothetical protein EJB05_45130 [Eragrostis curvula]